MPEVALALSGQLSPQLLRWLQLSVKILRRGGGGVGEEIGVELWHVSRTWQVEQVTMAAPELTVQDQRLGGWVGNLGECDAGLRSLTDWRRHDMRIYSGMMCETTASACVVGRTRCMSEKKGLWQDLGIGCSAVACAKSLRRAS